MQLEQRIAVRKQIIPQSSSLTYLLGDHLGSTSLAVDASTGEVVETRYKPWGEVRYQAGTTSTMYTFTGQMSYVNDFGLSFYNARWYDSALGRFAQADSIVPGGVQGYDRYAYVNNNPVMYTDPSGHSVDCGLGESGCQNSPTYMPPLASNEDSGDDVVSSLEDYSNCKDDPYCFYATQEDLISMSNILSAASDFAWIISCVFIALASAEIISAVVSSGVTIIFTPAAIVAAMAGIAFYIESKDSGNTSNYLESVALTNKSGNVVAIHRQESLFTTGYYTDDQGATHNTYGIVTRTVMELFSFLNSLDD